MISSGHHTQQLLLDEVREGPISRLILVGLEGTSTKALASASKKLAAWMRESGEFVYVANGEPAWSTEGMDLLFRYRYLLSPLVTETRFEQVSTPKGTTRTVSLEDYPPLRAFVEGFRAVLAGDLESLKQFYDVRLEGEQSSWVLILMPLEESVQELVQVLRFVGKEDSFTSIEIWEPNGDHSEMVITGQWK